MRPLYQQSCKYFVAPVSFMPNLIVIFGKQIQNLDHILVMETNSLFAGLTVVFQILREYCLENKPVLKMKKHFFETYPTSMIHSREIINADES